MSPIRTLAERSLPGNDESPDVDPVIVIEPLPVPLVGFAVTQFSYEPPKEPVTFHEHELVVVTRRVPLLSELVDPISSTEGVTL